MRTHHLGDDEWVCLDDGTTTPHEAPLGGLGSAPLGTSPLGG